MRSNLYSEFYSDERLRADLSDISIHSEHSAHYGGKYVIPTPDDKFTFSISNDSATITGLNGSNITDVVIPYKHVENNIEYPVTGIGVQAFIFSSLKSVTIPDTVTSIGGGAFQGCSYLETVNIGNRVETIGNAAFWSCGLTSVTIPDTVTSIGINAFWNCRSLTSITIGSGVTTIGDLAFYNCSGLRYIYYNGTSSDWNGIIKGGGNDPLLSAKIYYLGSDQMFEIYRNSNITPTTQDDFDFSISNDVATIEKYNGTAANVVVPYKITVTDQETGTTTEYLVKVIGAEAFTKKNGQSIISNTTLESVVLPGTITEIGTGCFAGCVNLNHVTIPEGIETIYGLAFWICRSLTSVTIPVSVKRIESMAFDDCDALTDIYYKGTLTQWSNTCAADTGSATIHYNAIIADSVNDVYNTAAPVKIGTWTDNGVTSDIYRKTFYINSYLGVTDFPKINLKDIGIQSYGDRDMVILDRKCVVKICENDVPNVGDVIPAYPKCGVDRVTGDSDNAYVFFGGQDAIDSSLYGKIQSKDAELYGYIDYIYITASNS